MIRLLHTSDWHLGARLGTQDRLPDQIARLGEIVAYAEREDVHVLLVAGDIFSERLDRDGLAKIVEHLAVLLRPLVTRGVQVVFLAGNHDRAHVFVLLHALKELVAPEASTRVFFVDRPELLQLTFGDERVQLVLLPYPTAERYDLAAGQWMSLDQKRTILSDALRERMDELSREASKNTGVPTVLVGHFLLAGVQGGMCVNEQEDVPIQSGDLPTYAYIALGHIHKAQHVRTPSIRYCGSIERMDQGEAADAKEVVLIELAAKRPPLVRSLPLQATPFARIEATSEEDLERWRGDLADPDRTLVALRLLLRRDQSVRALKSAAERFFPRLYDTDIRFVEDARAEALTTFTARADVASTVRAYLTDTLKDDPDAPSLIQMADQLLAEQAATEAHP